MRIEFTVPAIPIAQPRQRTRVMQMGGRAIAQNYTPKNSTISDYKATVRMAAQQAYDGAPIETALRMHLFMVFATKKKHRVPKATRPDCDNLAKGTCDALNGLLFKDDAQIVSLLVEKWHAGKDEQPHVRIVIEEITPSLAGAE